MADLHVHTALSPCAANEMTPPAIVAKAIAEGLDMIAICDHNSARNVAAVQQAGGDRLAVLAGIEITSAEECHVVGLFPAAAAAEAAAAEVGGALPQIDDGYEPFFGEQHVLGADGAALGRETLALATATPLDVNAVVALIHRHGGLAVAAHIDRRSFGVIGQLGLFPTDAGFDAVEVSRHVAPGSERDAECGGYGLPVVRSSDAHYLDDIGAARTKLHCAKPGFAELALALRYEDGRSAGDA
jgi:predicted metal-dependent phosphoesterase TrpH